MRRSRGGATREKQRGSRSFSRKSHCSPCRRCRSTRPLCRSAMICATSISSVSTELVRTTDNQNGRTHEHSCEELCMRGRRNRVGCVQRIFGQQGNEISDDETELGQERGRPDRPLHAEEREGHG